MDANCTVSTDAVFFLLKTNNFNTFSEVSWGRTGLSRKGTTGKVMLLLLSVSRPSPLIRLLHPRHLPQAQERCSAALCSHQQTGKKPPATLSSSSLKEDGAFNGLTLLTQLPNESQSQHKGNGAVQGEIRTGTSVSWDMGSAPLDFAPPAVLAHLPSWNPWVALKRRQTPWEPKVKDLTCSEVFLFLSYQFLFLSPHWIRCRFHVPLSSSVCRKYLYPFSVKLVPLKEWTKIQQYSFAPCIWGQKDSI